MGIHTFDIGVTLPIGPEIEELMKAFCFSVSARKKIQDINDEKNSAYVDVNLTKLEAEQQLPLGIKCAKVCRYVNERTGLIECSFRLEVEPKVLLENQRTICLYEPSVYNNQHLRDIFHTAINCFIDDNSFPSLVLLDNWNCARIDFTKNLHFDDKKEASLFFRLSKRTSRQTRQREACFLSDRSKQDQSTAEMNKSTKILFYDKQDQVEQAYEGMPDEQQKVLLKAAANVIRYEVQCKKGKVVTLQKKYGWPDHRIMRYLNAEVANEVLYQSYVETIGKGEFYYFYEAKKRIDASNLSTRLKNGIYNCMQLIAQARSLARGREQFLEGGHKLKNGKEIKGTMTTFRRYMRELEALNINPCMIPKDWRHTFGTHFHNPIDQLTAKESEENI